MNVLGVRSCVSGKAIPILPSFIPSALLFSIQQVLTGTRNPGDGDAYKIETEKINRFYFVKITKD